jgi:Ca2+-binding RTX toxin-like protein
MAILTGDAGNNSLTGTTTADTLDGFAGNDTLQGLGGADLLRGGGGNDALIGSEGADTLDGGDGIDQVAYFLDGGTQGVVVDLGAGTAVDTFGTQDRLVSIEQAYGSNLADTLRGGALTGDLLVGRGGNDLLQGLGGNDVLVGGEGADTLDGGTGIDQAAYFLETGTRGVVVDLGAGTAIDTFGTQDRLIGVEQVYGSNFADTINGSAGGDLLFGRGGNDLLQGLGGNDTLTGGEGADTLDGGAGTDQVAYFLETGTRGVVVDLVAGTAIDTYGTQDRLISIEQIHGSNLGDTLNGSGNGDLLFGREGADLIQSLGGDDTLIGGAGADTFYGGAGGDQIAYFLDGGTQGVVVDLRAGTATDTYGTRDSLIGIEYVHGSDFADTLLGTDGEGDRLFGRDGDDYIDGRDGNNLIYTGAGDDHIVVGTTAIDARDTVVIDGHGTKRITGTGAAGSPYAHHLVFDLDEAVTVNLATGIARSANMTLDFTAALHFLEVGGTSYDDHLIGGNTAHDYLEWLSGNQGNDTIDGGGGTGNTVIYDDEVRYGAFNHVTQQKEFGTRGVVVNLTTGVATDSFGFTDTLVNIDSVRATEFADNLFGTAQTNGFWGLKGADTMNGGAGSDRVHYGEDSLTGGTAGVTVNLAAGFAIDGFGDRDVLISIEEAYGSDFNDTLLGSNDDNRLYGYKGADNLSGGAGRDTMDGGEGDDLLDGGIGDDELWGAAGNDTLNGGDGNDIARYLDAERGINANLVAGQVADGMGGLDTLINIEGIYGSDHNDTVQGGDRDEFISGQGGNDSLYGGLGIDTILGGAGADLILGGGNDDELWGEAGNDTIDGGAGSDLVRYRNSTAGVTVNLTTGIGNDGMGGTDSLISIERVHGSDHADTLTGDSTANRLFGFAGNDQIAGGDGADTMLGGDGDDALSGNAGDDELWGGLGNDTLNGGDGSDLVRYRSVPGAIRVDLAAGTAGDGEGGTDSLISVENIDGSDQGDVILGNAEANRLFGFAGNDRIEGREGNDILLGGTGDDLLMGGAGDDQLEGDAGTDTLNGGEGSDLVRYRTATGSMTISLASGTAAEAGGTTDTLISIENADGSDQNDLMTGDAAANRLFGFAGADTIAGGTGEDVLVGGAGGDTYLYRAGDGYDIVNDLGDVGGAGDRVIIQDYLAEQARIYQSGAHIVLDFGVTRDVVVLANSLAAGAAGTIESVQFADGAVWTHAMLVVAIGQLGTRTLTNGTSGNDTVFGTTDGDTIDGGAGDDVIHALGGNDTIHGGAGNDTIRSGDGDDIVNGDDGNDLLILGNGSDTVDGGTGSDTVVFDIAFASIGDNYSFDLSGVFTVTGNQISGVELFRFADRDITAAELQTLASNAAPVSTLPEALSTNEGTVRIDLAPYFSDAEGDRLTFSAADLPAGITLSGSVLSGQIEAGTVPFAVTIIVSDGTHELRQILDWTIINVNAAPTGSVTIAGSPSTGQELTASSTVADADGIDTATLSWAWLRNGTAIGGATGETYTLTAADVGAQISVRLSFTDLFGTAESVTSAQTSAVEASALFLIGTAAHDELRGGLGNDTLIGLDGPDLLEGLDGNDSLQGGDGNDTLIGGTGDDFLFGGETAADLRDVMYGGAGNDFMDGGYGNDELRGDIGNDTIAGGFGADLLIGGAGNDVLTGSALGDEIYGNDGNDFINGGFGHDRMNGGAGADSFYHLGILDHGSDWVQDYRAAEGDVLQFGLAGATRAQFQVNFTETARAGTAGVAEAFVIYRPTGQIMWALIDGQAQDHINLQLGNQVFDLMA